jgi:hypothetical protein
MGTIHTLHPQQPRYSVRLKPCGRWAVVYQLAGGAGLAEASDALTRGAAEREADWLNAEHDRSQRRLADERALAGLRPDAPQGVVWQGAAAW